MSAQATQSFFNTGAFVERVIDQLGVLFLLGLGLGAAGATLLAGI